MENKFQLELDREQMGMLIAALNTHTTQIETRLYRDGRTPSTEAVRRLGKRDNLCAYMERIVAPGGH